MADNVRVRSLSVFLGSDEGRQFYVGDEFEVSSMRAADLERIGLVERVKAAKPAAVAPAPEPRRGRG